MPLCPKFLAEGNEQNCASVFAVGSWRQSWELVTRASHVSRCRSVSSWLGREPPVESLTNSWGTFPYSGREYIKLFTLGLGSPLACDVRHRFGRTEAWPTPCSWAGSRLHRGRRHWCGLPPLCFVPNRRFLGPADKMEVHTPLARLGYLCKQLWSWECVDYW